MSVAPEHRHADQLHQHDHRFRMRRRLRFWAIALVLCFLTALVVVGIKFLVESVGSSRHLRYEPVDVLPSTVSPRHKRENEELERRDKAVKDKQVVE